VVLQWTACIGQVASLLKIDIAGSGENLKSFRSAENAKAKLNGAYTLFGKVVFPYVSTHIVFELASFLCPMRACERLPQDGIAERLFICTEAYRRIHVTTGAYWSTT
jgi:hypothetical protein